MKFNKDEETDGVEVIFPQGGPPNDVSYVLSWAEAPLQLKRLGIKAAEQLVDFIYNFGVVTYEIATGRYYYDPVGPRTLILPRLGGVEVPLR